jgi:predicted signal transduction protein with EAL and GGDEF domain
MHIQHYVEEKRVEINDSLKQKTIDKINNGSNIRQYTYVIRLHEKKYRLSPDNAVFKLFKKDYKFMMLEWERLKGISDQQSEYQNLNEFKLSAVKYDHSMLLWVDLNNKLVSEVLPKMKALGNDVINSAVLSANRSVNHMKEKHTNTTVTLLVVSVITIFLGVVFGSMIARSISGVVTTLQNGLINFFEYLNQKQKVAYPIEVHGNDEVSIMADVINKNIIKIQDLLNRKADYQQALLEWSRVDYQDESITIQKATELSAKALHVERVSIWLFNHDRTVLRCADIFLSKSSVHENGDVMIAEKYPQYFENIGDREMLISNQVRSDDRFEEFNNGYLEKHNIHSILDMAIIQDGILTGIIRHEKVGKVKSWQPDEQDFAKSVVSAISLSLEIKKRRVIQEELKAQKEMLHHHAHHDPLTGLPNRFLFNDRLNQVIKQARRNETKIAILFIDLDHFKGINDSMGHNVGDELLKEVASRLKQQIRQTDTLARLGGDEFSIVLKR